MLGEEKMLLNEIFEFVLFLTYHDETKHKLKFSLLITKVSKFICLASFQSLM